MQEYYVYEYIDPRNMCVFYVGKGHSDRLAVHMQSAKLKDKSPKSKLILEILADGLQPIIVKKEIFQSEDKALNYEKELIMHYGLNNLTNRTAGGQGISGFASFTGRRHTKEAKEKVRQAQLGQNNSMAGNKWHRSEAGKQSFKEKTSGEKHHQFGKPLKSKTKKLISEKLKGLKLTETQKQIRSENMKKIWKDRKLNGIIINRTYCRKKYPGTLIHKSGKTENIACLKEFCYNTTHSFRVLLMTAKTKQFLKSGKSKDIKFEPK